MNTERKVLRLGAWVILCAIALRLVSSSTLGASLQQLDTSRLGAAIIFLQTGRLVRTDTPQEPTETTEPTELILTEPEPALPVFSAEDAALVEINNTSGLSSDTEAALLQPLSWRLRSGTPTVLILHTHGTESYTKTETYTESSAYRTQDTAYNVVSIGDRLAQLLEAGGIGVIHDRNMYDVPSYSGSYDAARLAIQSTLEEHPSISLVLDIHRDAAENAFGEQIDYTVSTDRGEAAKLMLVMGTDGGGSTHPNWQDNFSLAVKLQTQLEGLCAGICRPISLRQQRFNQDLCPGGLLVEVGATGNTRQEALLAAEYLAQAILALANGTATTG